MVELQGVIWRVVSASTLHSHYTTLHFFAWLVLKAILHRRILFGPLSVVWCSIRVVSEMVLYSFKLLFNR